MLQREDPRLRWFLAPPSACFHHPVIWRNRHETSQPSPTTFRESRTTSPLPGTVMLKPKRSRPLTLTRNDAPSQISRWERRLIWRRKIYVSASSRRVEVQSSILAMLVHLRSPNPSQRPPTTRSSCQTNIRSNTKSTPVALNVLMTTTPFSFLGVSLQNHPPSTQKTISISSRLSWITVLCVKSVSFWFIGRVIRI